MSCRQEQSDSWQSAGTQEPKHLMYQLARQVQSGLLTAWQRFVLIINLPTAAAIAGELLQLTHLY